MSGRSERLLSHRPEPNFTSPCRVGQHRQMLSDTAWANITATELLVRSYRNSRFANLPQIVLGYREERTTLEGTPLTRCLHATQSRCLADIAARRYPGSKVCRQLHLSVGAITTSSKNDSSSLSRKLGNRA
jgi:hypothetical protein